MTKRRRDFTEMDHFILEAAQQLGFRITDDDAEQYAASDESIVEFASRVAQAAIEQARGARPMPRTDQAPRVFVVQQPATYDRKERRFIPKYDLSPASAHGRLVFLLGPGNIFKDRMAQAVNQMGAMLQDFADSDFILAVGDPVAIAAVGLIAGRVNYGRVKLLKWDRMAEAYEVFQIDSGKGESAR